MRGRLQGMTALCSGLMVLTLLASFGLHAVQTNHVHYGVVHTHTVTPEGVTHQEETIPTAGVITLGEQMHMADKKLWLVLVFVVFISLAVQLTLYGSWNTLLIAYEATVRSQYCILCRPRREYSYLDLMFSIGILNPKLH